MTQEAFERAATTAKPDCPKCHGTGKFQYSTRGTPHFTICDLCCTHAYGWWKLGEHYGRDNGKWCCRGGCGKVVEQIPVAA